MTIRERNICNDVTKKDYNSYYLEKVLSVEKQVEARITGHYKRTTEAEET